LIPDAQGLADSVIERLQHALTAAVSAYSLAEILKLLAPSLQSPIKLSEWMRTVPLHVRDSPTSGAFLLTNPKLYLNRMADLKFADTAKIYLGPPPAHTSACAAAMQHDPVHRCHLRRARK
jgi:hypothetical protein